MRVTELRCDEDAELHIMSRHGVTLREVEEAVFHRGIVRRGREPGIYMVLGRSEAGRYLLVIVRDIGKGVARVITARDMNKALRRLYLNKMAH